MHIDAKSFFILVTTLAAGGAAGYVASEKRLLPPLEPRKEPQPVPPAPPAPLASMPAPAAVDAAPPPPPAPACDDTTGAPGDCPPLGLPTIEGGCGGYANFHCNEFKQAMKPRVAQTAVACLAKLNPQERCTPQRVNLCGHAALMSACPDAAGSTSEICREIVKSCAAAPIPPSPADCERTLAGMTTLGRERMLACVKKHCADKGLLFCEAVGDPN
jgi:hypothetical protein